MTKAEAKALFETGDVPNQANFSDLFDELFDTDAENAEAAAAAAASATTANTNANTALGRTYAALVYATRPSGSGSPKAYTINRQVNVASVVETNTGGSNYQAVITFTSAISANAVVHIGEGGTFVSKTTGAVTISYTGTATGKIISLTVD